MSQKKRSPNFMIEKNNIKTKKNSSKLAFRKISSILYFKSTFYFSEIQNYLSSVTL